MYRLIIDGTVVAVGSHFGDMHVLSKLDRYAGRDCEIEDEDAGKVVYRNERPGDSILMDDPRP